MSGLLETSSAYHGGPARVRATSIRRPRGPRCVETSVLMYRVIQTNQGQRGVGRVLASEKIYTFVGHDERSGIEPDIRPTCPVASSRAARLLASGKSKI